MSSSKATAWLAAAAAFASVGCQPSADAQERARSRPTSTSDARFREALATRATSPFVCRGSECRQEHPRLPDTGEWVCAERDGIVWCAGGEPAAGVVSGPVDDHFRCASRWGAKSDERICIDERPQYPTGERAGYACRFEQETALVRVCRPAQVDDGAFAVGRAIPACWYDKDCPSGACDRGACGCGKDADCLHGRCSAGLCVTRAP
jgi:hypothetical protein